MAHKSVVFKVQKDFSLSHKADLPPGLLPQLLFLLPLTKSTGFLLYTRFLGFQSTSSARTPSQPHVQCIFHHLPERLCLHLKWYPNFSSSLPSLPSPVLATSAGNTTLILPSSISFTESPAHEMSRFSTPPSLPVQSFQLPHWSLWLQLFRNVNFL